MLTTLKRAKKLMGIPVDDTSEDFYITTALAAASNIIEREAKRSFEYKNYTQTIDGPGTQFLRLRNYPVHSVSKLNVCGADWMDKEFKIESENGMLFYRSGWPCGPRAIEVEYLAGYILPSDDPDAPKATLPENIELACVLFAQMLLNDPNVKSERVGDISVTYENADMPAAVKSLIRL
ncbi:hypothetical protein GNQ08_20560 [Paenibacillus macerans]|uniref:Phage gp6-like head-tail connector protein n=2 Tax=Paenibacillus macerans TaxID=44252 RepID=A0A6N8EYN1_PAEMA|nr:hypothetical protein [Paenibacillus macerans]